MEDHGLLVVVWQRMPSLNDRNGRLVKIMLVNMNYYSGDIADISDIVIELHLSQERYRSYSVALEPGAYIPRSEEERGNTRHGDSRRGACCNDHRK